MSLDDVAATPSPQYPDEMEYLYVPCSFLEQQGERTVEATPAGVVELIPVRVNANLKTKTVWLH